LVAPAALLLAGCGLFGGGQQGWKTSSWGVPYNGLQGKSLAIVVLVPTPTVDEFPRAQFEISSFLINEFAQHISRSPLDFPATQPASGAAGGGAGGVSFPIMNAQDIINWQSDTLNWQSLSEKEIGKKFGVDRVLFIHVLDYSTHKTLTPGNLQGHLRALCKVVEVDSPAPPNEPAWTGLVDVAWPANQPLSPIDTQEDAVRMRTLESFATRLVGYFYPEQTPP
jgi:hypothetical protein